MTDMDTDRAEKEVNGFEDEVRKIVADYSAPRNISEELIEFLIDSGNAYAIGELYMEIVYGKRGFKLIPPVNFFKGSSWVINCGKK